MKNKRLHTDDYLDLILRSEPNFELSSEFEKKLSQKIEKIVSWETYFKQFFTWIAVGIFSLSVAISILFFAQKDIFTILLSFTTQHYQLVLMVIFLICSVVFFDTVLLNYLFYRYGKKE